jgi:hypothetical protein
MRLSTLLRGNPAKGLVAESDTVETHGLGHDRARQGEDKVCHTWDQPRDCSY